MIRKEAYVSEAVSDELKRIIVKSEVRIEHCEMHLLSFLLG